MIANKIRNARKALSALGGNVTEDVWAVIKCIQAELDDAATQAQQIEELLPATAPEEHGAGGHEPGTISYTPIAAQAPASA